MVNKAKKSLARKAKGVKKAKTSKRKKIDKPVHHAKRVAKNVSLKRKVKKDSASRKRAEYLSTLPKGKVKRFFFRLHPKRVLRYWFSKRGLVMTFKLAGLCLFAGLLFLFGLFAYFRKDLPTNFADLRACIGGQTTEYYDNTGETLLWASKGNVECNPVDLEQISPNLINAVLAIEDKDFYDHGGFDTKGIIRAFYKNFTGGKQQGGSTITQQYVKLAILKSNERVYSRKIRELILAVELERSFTKDEILNAYLNVASFGSVYDGVEAAARGYFQKPASELTIDESALLAAAIPAPSYYWSNDEALVQRQKFVIGHMRDQGRITQEEYDAAIGIDTLAKVSRDREQFKGIIAPHFVLETEKRLIEEFGEDVRKLGFRVITTVDLKAQALAEEAVTKAIPLIESRGMDNGAAIAIEVETGKVIAHVGSRDFDYPDFGQTNTVTTQRDPGSAFKIFDYASVIQNTNDWGPGSTFYDYKTELATGWSPQNYNGRHNGPVTMRFALGQSFNIPAIKAMYIAGIDETHKLAYDAGLRTKVRCGGNYCGLATAIGSGVEMRLDELTNSYATFAREGVYQPLAYIERIYDADGELVREWSAAPEKVIDPQTTYLLTDMLSDNSVRFAKSSYTVNGATIAVKTGTTDDFKNNTVLSYSKKVAFGAWMGHHDITKSFNESHTTPVKSLMFKTFMEGYHQDIPPEDKNAWAQPEGIKKVQIDRTSGYQVSEGGTWDKFPAWYVPKKQDFSKETEIDTVSGKRATECTPARARQVVSGGKILGELSADDPSYKKWMSPIIRALGSVIGGEIPADEDDLHNCDDVRPTVVFSSAPAICDESCVITADVVAGTHALSQVNFMIDGQILPGGSFSVAASGTVSFNYTPNFSGSKQLVVEVLDSALYYTQETRTISFNQGVPIVLNSITIGANFLNVGWNQAASDLVLKFGGACSAVTATTLPSNTTSKIVNSTDFPTGVACSAFIDQSGTPTNSVSFTIPE